ncbi:MAG: helix-turn-helix transcriptional regulator [Oscillospiraceae bacterium]|nr:helix-turn-helix transcriptional regulator [Oscillospiraceae bacterium]
MNKEYKQALEQAKINLADIKERGGEAIGSSWEDVRRELYTPEQIRECDLRVAIISELIKARNEKNISQRELEQLSGVKQPIISRMESGTNNPQLDTVLKVLAPLGKTLYVGDLQN